MNNATEVKNVEIWQIDYQCTLWPDNWFGISLTKCCIEHDLGGSNSELFWCVSKLHPMFFIIGAIMFIGLTIIGPIYRAKMRRKQNEINKERHI